jgi:hypothetical protein
VDLPLEWVRTNFPNLLHSLKKRAENNLLRHKYFDVPIQDVHVSRRKHGKKTLPKIVYKQHDENTCAFDCLCSGLAYLSFEKEASALHEYRKEFYANLFEEYFDKIPQHIIRFIRKHVDFKAFRKLYDLYRLKVSHDVMHFKCGKQDIRFLQLSGKDGSKSHAICVVANFIFDSNCDSALEFNQANMDDCCNECEFDHIVMGYYFKKRP